MKTISEMSAQEVARWLNENATQQPEDIERQKAWNVLDGLYHGRWESHRVSGEDQYGRTQYEFVSGNGFFPN